MNLSLAFIFPRSSDSNRSDLFSGSSSGNKSNDDLEIEMDSFESHNHQQLVSLGEKVSIIKQLSKAIGKNPTPGFPHRKHLFFLLSFSTFLATSESSSSESDVQEQNSFLDEMQSGLQRTADTLKDTTGRLLKLLEGGSGNTPLCYLVAFITFVFLVLYYMARK